jgi:hypothetical protein
MVQIQFKKKPDSLGIRLREFVQIEMCLNLGNSPLALPIGGSVMQVVFRSRVHAVKVMGRAQGARGNVQKMQFTPCPAPSAPC